MRGKKAQRIIPDSSYMSDVINMRKYKWKHMAYGNATNTIKHETDLLVIAGPVPAEQQLKTT
jgi:hypothetical protein